jgi:glutathione S-transferase
MLTVHHLEISQSDRIVWLCEELGLDYELKIYRRQPGNRAAPDEYKAASPTGTAPYITDGDVVLGESGAIVDYLITRHGNGRLRPGPDHPDYVDYLYWFHYANGSLMPTGFFDVIGARQGRIAPDKPGGGLYLRGDRAFASVNARLAKVPYLAGSEFTAADIMSLFPLTTMRTLSGRDITGLDHLKAYLKRISERPALQRAMAKGDPGMVLKID